MPGKGEWTHVCQLFQSCLRCSLVVPDTFSWALPLLPVSILAYIQKTPKLSLQVWALLLNHSLPVQQGAGWAVILGFGVFFALITMFLVWLDVTFGGTQLTSEEFNTAGRSINTGLTASVIVSQWTWAATLLQSANVAWKYGVSGPFWYAAGATIQVLLFAILALHVKLKAPRAHTCTLLHLCCAVLLCRLQAHITQTPVLAPCFLSFCVFILAP
jgi:hypothetical protein